MKLEDYSQDLIDFCRGKLRGSRAAKIENQAAVRGYLLTIDDRAERSDVWDKIKDICCLLYDDYAVMF